MACQVPLFLHRVKGATHCLNVSLCLFPTPSISAHNDNHFWQDVGMIGPIFLRVLTRSIEDHTRTSKKSKS